MGNLMKTKYLETLKQVHELKKSTGVKSAQLEQLETFKRQIKDDVEKQKNGAFFEREEVTLSRSSLRAQAFLERKLDALIHVIQFLEEKAAEDDPIDEAPDFVAGSVLGQKYVAIKALQLFGVKDYVWAENKGNK